jgi:ABC-type branched-subunit amino acid transport system ATPase component
MTPPEVTGGGLVVDDLTVRYGGHVAVSELSLSAPSGQITGLIGPNGAGKTTTFNAISGLLRPTSGTLTFLGTDITGRSVPARARLGIGRTFQRMELYLSMTVAENVRLGAEGRLVGANPFRQLVSSRTDAAAIDAAAADALSRCGLESVTEVRVDQLSTGSKRLVELARALAGGYRMLLLDEPSSGLDQRETETFGEILRSCVQLDGTGMLLVEHDMSLVMSVCSRIWVLDFGRLICDGTPKQVQTSPLVKAAYLGSHAGLDHAEAALELAEAT